MVFRGFLTSLFAFIVLRGKIGKVDKYAYLIALTLPFATLGLFNGIRSWGAGPTIIIITATPLVNYLIGPFIGRKISLASVIGLVLVLGGVIVARWGGEFKWEGFLWSVFGTVMNGILYEFFSRSKSTPTQKCFYSSFGMGLLGLILSLTMDSDASWQQVFQTDLLFSVLIFAFIGGFIYWLANLIAFENLPTTEASILAQGETPAVIIGAWFFLGEQLSLLQWTGVGIALLGAMYLSSWLSKQKN